MERQKKGNTFREARIRDGWIICNDAQGNYGSEGRVNMKSQGESL